MYEAVIRALKNPVLGPDIKYQTLRRTVDIMRECSQDGTHLNLSRSIEIRPLVTDLLRSDTTEYQGIARQFMKEFTDRT